MKLIITSCIVILYVLSTPSLSRAQSNDINFFCKSDCIAKGGTIGKCNELCSTSNESGNSTKDPACLSKCMGQPDETAYSCYSKCNISGNAAKMHIEDQAVQNAAADSQEPVKGPK